MSPTGALTEPAISLRPMTPDDLPAAHALSDELRWPHRLADWEQALRHGEGFVALVEGALVGTALRFDWGPAHATLGLVIVQPAHQGRRIGRRLMEAALRGMDGRTLLLHATAEGLGLYQRLGFVTVGEVQQHQGLAQPAPLVALGPGWRVRPAGANDLPALVELDQQARGMPRSALLAELLALAESAMVLDHQDQPRGFALLRRFGRGDIIGPVVAPDLAGAQALIAQLAGHNVGRFTRIDIDAALGLGPFVEALGLRRVDGPTTMRRGPAEPAAPGAPLLAALVTQAMG